MGDDYYSLLLLNHGQTSQDGALTQSINRDIYFGVIIRYVHIIVCINNSIRAFLHKLSGFLQTDILKRPLLLHPVKLFVHISTVDL